MTTRFSCFYVPDSCHDIIQNESFKSLLFEQNGKRIELQVPTLTPAIIEQITRTLQEHQREYLSTLKTNHVIDILDETVQKWLNPRYELRQFAEEWLPIITGYDAEMIRLFLSRYIRQFRKEKLQRMVDEDFANPLILDEFRPRKSGGFYRAYGPEVVTHIFSGNVPALPLWSLSAGLLLKSATLGKVSSAEPLFPVLFAQSLKEVDPAFANGVAILWWKGGEEPIEKAAFSKSDAVVAYGGKDTIESVKQKVPAKTRFLAHGHKVSFGIITKECLSVTKAWNTAKLAAHDASWFDQQGCLSPHVFFVERGGSISPHDFAGMLANEMENFQQKHPRAPLTDEEHHAIVKKRSALEFESFSNDRLTMIKSEQSSTWTIVYREGEDSKQFSFSPLNRFVTVVSVDCVLDVQDHVRELTGHIQTVGVGCSPQDFQSIIRMLGSCRVNRICSLGSMPHPEPGWHHDGRFHLADLVYFCDVESSLENQMDEFDPYRD